MKNRVWPSLNQRGFWNSRKWRRSCLSESGTAAAAAQVDTSLIPFGKDAEGDDISYGQHILDALLEKGVQVEAVFCPEHGFRETEDAGVGMLPLPVVHGLTLGELAQMINGEGWLDSGADACDLTVIPCRNYTHRDKIPLIRRPSPNLKDMRAVYLYSSTCFFENTLVSVGRGTENPFEIYGSPYLEYVDGFESSFTPQSMSGASNPPFQGETCWGADLRDVPIEDIFSAGINVSYLVDAYHAVMEASPGSSFWGSPDGSGQYWIDKLSGSSDLRLMIEDGATAEEIKDSWQEDISFFLEQRKPYLLYEE